MAEIHSRKIKEHKLDTVLAEDISFSGELSFTQELMIKGKFEGNIQAGGDLYIAEDADVTAEIDARSIHVRGRVKGNVHAESRVELMGNAEVIGNITAPKIIMETGCRFEGISRMVPAEDSFEK
ncbi:MAG: polymer-forming cytoskeletal protein [Spirochaetales bacterium]|nr:polymer-forming cytoskeletal protein [Spirochaetales bacterium]